MGARHRLLALGRRDSGRPLGAVVLGVLAMIVGGGLLLDVEAAIQSQRAVWILTSLLGGAVVLILRRSHRLDWLAPPIIYALVFWMFHLGLIASISVWPALVEDVPIWARAWLETSEARTAALVSLLFMVCYALGLSLAFPKPHSPHRAWLNSEPRCELINGGWIVIVLGAATFLWGVAEYGWSVFFAGYGTFFEVHNPFSYSVVLVVFGLILQLAGNRPTRNVLITGLVLWVPVALLTFGAGARTAPLFGGAVILAVLHKRGWRCRTWIVFASAVLLLSVTSLVRVARYEGLQAFLAPTEMRESASPVFGLMELGASLRPVEAVIVDIRILGRNYFWGETYAYPFIRQLQRLRGMRVEDEFNDPRFVARFLNRDYGSWGFSTVAEAYYNGGPIAVALFALAWGVCLALLERRSFSPYGLALLAAVLIPMMINIRNSFVYVPAWIFSGCAWILVCHFLGKGCLVRFFNVAQSAALASRLRKDSF